jgi:hypothetical protein
VGGEPQSGPIRALGDRPIRPQPSNGAEWWEIPTIVARAAAVEQNRGMVSWARFWPIFYRLLRFLDPVIRPIWRTFGIGNTIELLVPGRSSGRQRRLFLGLLSVGHRRYLGHPSLPTGWTRNLEAAERATLRFHDGTTLDVRAIPLPPGPERDAVIAATFRQHPFPGTVLYWLSRRHLRANGTFFRLERAGERANRRRARARAGARTGPRTERLTRGHESPTPPRIGPWTTLPVPRSRPH